VDKVQTADYSAAVEEWKNAAELYGTGWDEDGPEIPVDYDIDVAMEPYLVGGVYSLPAEGFGSLAIAHPECSVSVRVQKVKAHMNRLITALEFSAEDQERGGDLYDFVEDSVHRLRESHHGDRWRAYAEGDAATRLEAHLTGIPSTQRWRLGVGVTVTKENGSERTDYESYIRTTMFTTCPFVLWETGGKQSHTQRTHIEIRLTAPDRVNPGPIMRELNTRLVPVMSAMRIPDEVVQVLKSFSGPSFTEDAAVRVIKILRGITDQFTDTEKGDTVARVRVVSEDSHLAHDVVTNIEAVLD